MQCNIFSYGDSKWRRVLLVPQHNPLNLNRANKIFYKREVIFLITVLGINKDGNGNIISYHCIDGKEERDISYDKLLVAIYKKGVSNATISINVNIPVQPQSNSLQGYLTSYTTELQERYSKFLIGLKQVWELRDRINMVIDCVNAIYRENRRLSCNYKRSRYSSDNPAFDIGASKVMSIYGVLDIPNKSNKPFYFSSWFTEDYITEDSDFQFRAYKNGVIQFDDKTRINYAQVPSFEWFKSFYETKYPSYLSSVEKIKRLCDFPEHLVHFEQMLQVYINIINKK